MRILQVSCEGLGNGGVQAVIMNICRNMPEIQFDILLFTSERRYYDDEFEILGGKIFRVPNYEGFKKIRRKIDYYIRFFKIFTGTYVLIKKNGPYDAIHCHNDLESGICNLAAYFAGVKIRISHAHTCHNKFSKKNIIGYVYKKILQRLMNLTSSIKISCTQEALISIFGEKYLNKFNSFIIPNSIDTIRFKKTQINTKANTVNIVHIGMYCENKNQMLLIEILPYILNEYPNVKLQLLGSGEEYKNKLEKKLVLFGIESNVEFLPHDTDVKEVLNKARIFIFPSINEGFGIALIEAQASEVPCLVSDTVPKQVDCGLCKFLSLSEKIEVWAREVLNILRENHRLKLDWGKLNVLDNKNYAKKIKSIYKGDIF